LSLKLLKPLVQSYNVVETPAHAQGVDEGSGYDGDDRTNRAGQVYTILLSSEAVRHGRDRRTLLSTLKSWRWT
jgi:hypothetical protein